MLIRAHRFHGYNSLRGVYGRGQTLRAPLLNLKFQWREPNRPFRVAVVVSRKVSKSAVVRGRIRRRIYEVVRQQEKNLPGGLDLAFMVFSDELASLEAKRLEKTITGLLQQAVRSGSSSGLSSGSGTDSHGIVKSKGNSKDN